MLQQQQNNVNSQFKQLLTQKLLKTWIITQLKLSNQKQLPKGQENKIESFKSILAFPQIDYFNALENQFIGKHFDSIIVLPQKVQENYSYQDIQLIEKYNPINDMKINLLAYRLAHKYLSSTGILILSTSQEDFIKQQNNKNSNPNNCSTSQYLRDCQVNYLGVIIGDRDHTDLNSWSVIALSEQISSSDPEYVSSSYQNWAEGIKLPMPGSFALFKRKNSDPKKCSFIQYL